MNTVFIIIIVVLVLIILVLLSNKTKNNTSDFDKYVNNHPIQNKTIRDTNNRKIAEPRSVYYKAHEKEIEDNKLATNYSVKNIDIEDKTSIFYDKNIVITGTFNNYAREDIASYIHSKGGARRSSITSATDIVIIGSISPGPAKLLQIEQMINNGSKLNVIQEDEFVEIIKLEKK